MVFMRQALLPSSSVLGFSLYILIIFACDGTFIFLLSCQTLGNYVIYYLRQGGNVFAGVCLFVCLYVSNITQKVMDGSF